MATYKEIKGVTIQTRDEDPVVGGMLDHRGHLVEFKYW